MNKQLNVPQKDFITRVLHEMKLYVLTTDKEGAEYIHQHLKYHIDVLEMILTEGYYDDLQNWGDMDTINFAIKFHKWFKTTNKWQH